MNIVGINRPKNIGATLSAMLVVLLILFNIAGYYFCFGLVQDSIRREIRNQVRNGLSEESLTRIEINPLTCAQIKWLEKDREFVYHGDMFDVVRINIEQNRTIYFCIRDFREKKLIKDFAQNHGSNQKAKKIISSISLNFIFHSARQIIPEINDVEYITSPSSIHTRKADLADPPPKHLTLS